MFITTPQSLKRENESQKFAIAYINNLPSEAVEGVTLKDFEQHEEVFLEGPMLKAFQLRGGMVTWAELQKRETGYQTFLEELNRDARTQGSKA